MGGQFEIVIYRLKPEVNRDQFLEISSRATEWLRNRPGYLGRELMEDDSGDWVDLVRWSTMEDALAAASAFMEVPEAAVFMDAVEPESIKMLHPVGSSCTNSRNSAIDLTTNKSGGSAGMQIRHQGQAMTRGLQQ